MRRCAGHAGFAETIRGIECRTAARSRIFSQFLLSLTETRCARFSAPADVITFSGLIYLTTNHQSTSLEAFKKDNMRSRLAA
jgi:hypothetical protein